jgi:hypothetical protein
MPFIPADNALGLAIDDSMREDARPFLIVRDRDCPIPKDIEVDGVVSFDEAEEYLDWLDPDTRHQLRTAGHALFRPATPAAPYLADTIKEARRRQVCISSFLLAAAQAKVDGVPDEELDAEASCRWSRFANSVFPLDAQTFNLNQYIDVIPGYWRASVIENIVNYPAVYHHHCFNTDCTSGRLHAAAVSAVDAVTRAYGNADAPLQDFLPRENPLRFRTILLRAFHGNHNATWHVASLEPISAALRVVIAVGRLARDRSVPLTAGLASDMRVLGDPWIVNDEAGREDVHELYIAIERFVKAIIGADECTALAAQRPSRIPDHVWIPPRQFLPLLPELKFDWLQG